MKNIKLFKLLNALSKKEFNQLEYYINSPFFLKKNKDPLKLYHAFKTYYPFSKKNAITKKQLFLKVYPNVKYEDGKMRNLLARTVKIVDSYYLYLEYDSNKFDKDKKLATIYSKRNIYSEFVNNTNQLLSTLQDIQQRDSKYYYDKFTLEKNFYFHLKTSKENAIDLLEKVFHSFHNYLALQQANLKLEINSRARIFQHSLNTPTINYSKDYTRSNISLHLINNLNSLLCLDDDQLYHETKADFEKNLQLLTRTDQVNIYIGLQNYSIQQIPINPKKFAPILLETYQMGLKYQLIFDNGVLLSSAYLNIVIMGLGLKKYDWTLSFIQEYEQKLPNKEGKFIKKLSLGYLYFSQEAYEDVIAILSIDRFPDIRYVTNVRSIQIRAYFKLFQKNDNYYKSLINHCDAFDRFIDREKSLIAVRKLRNKKFTSYVRKFANSIHRGRWNTKQKEEFKKGLALEKEIILRPWLESILEYV